MGDVALSHIITGTKIELRLVEGIFDYFTFYTLLKDQDTPVAEAISGFYLKKG
jgi:hypothetical protein